MLMVVLIVGVCNETKADREPPRSLSEMNVASSLVADGVVTSVTDLSTEKLNHPDGNPVLRVRRQAVFQIEKIQKGQINGKGDFVYLEFWKITDPRYKGEVAPDLAVNERFRLYADATEVDQSGQLHVFLHSRNSVRPEALETPALTPRAPVLKTATDAPPPVSETKPILPMPSEEPQTIRPKKATP